LCTCTAAWYCEWSDAARKAFLNELLTTVVPPDPLASLLSGLGVDAMAGMPDTPSEQHRWAVAAEEQVRVAAVWAGCWPDHLKNELLNELEGVDQVSDMHLALHCVHACVHVRA
jgi:hypothetical protein